MTKLSSKFHLFSKINLPKTLWYNFRYLKLKDAIKLPILIGGGVKINKLGVIKFKCPIKTNLLSFGVFNVFIDDNRYPTKWENNGVVIVGGPVTIRTGANIGVDTCGVLALGGNVDIGHLTTIFAHKNITIGSRVSISWNAQLIDTDFHFMENLSTHSIMHKTAPITIGDECWIGNHSSVGKGVSLADGTTVASYSVVTKTCSTPNSLLAGMPATIKKSGSRRVFDKQREGQLEKEYWLSEFGQTKY